MTLQRDLSREMDRELLSELTETPVHHVGNGNGSDQELTESPVHPFLVHMVAPFINGIGPNYYHQVKGEALWACRKLYGRQEFFNALQNVLIKISYRLESSAAFRVGSQLSMRANNLKKKMVGKNKPQRQKMLSEWATLIIYPYEICLSPIDAYSLMKEREEVLLRENAELRETVEYQSAQLYQAMAGLSHSSLRHRGKGFIEVGQRQQETHLFEMQ